MKNIYIITLAITIVSTGCSKNLTNQNVNPKLATQVPGPLLFSTAEKAFADITASPSVNYNIFRLIMQQWTETTYLNESNYDFTNRNSNQGYWRQLYAASGGVSGGPVSGVLVNLHEAKRLIQNQDTSAFAASDFATRKNQLAIASIMEVYTWSVLVNMFGNVPYTQALNIEQYPSPAYDDAKTIYYALLDTLQKAISELDATNSSYGSADIIYGGDVASWQKCGYSLLLKLGMTLADSDPIKAGEMVTAAVVGGVFTANADNMIFPYTSSQPNNNPVYDDLIVSGRKDFVGGKPFVDLLLNTNDPRLPIYFKKINSGNGDSYVGAAIGGLSTYANFSAAGVALEKPDLPGVLLSYDEVEFYLAEAANRSLGGVTGADIHYNNAVTASITFWGGSATDAAAFLAIPTNAYVDITSIATQKWVALYNRGFDAWTEWRRLDIPVLTPAGNTNYPTSAVIPVRYTYPVGEQQLNNSNYMQAVNAMGMGTQDVVTKRLFWDTK